MGDEMVRTHVLLPRELVQRIDRAVGPRRRSEFLAAAADDQLSRAARLATLRRYAGFLKDADIPGWETPEATREWVRRQRRIEGQRDTDADTEGRPE